MDAMAKTLIADEDFNQICWASLRGKIEAAECAEDDAAALGYYLVAFEIIIKIVSSVISGAELLSFRDPSLRNLIKTEFKLPSLGSWLQLDRICLEGQRKVWRNLERKAREEKEEYDLRKEQSEAEVSAPSVSADPDKDLNIKFHRPDPWEAHQRDRARHYLILDLPQKKIKPPSLRDLQQFVTSVFRFQIKRQSNIDLLELFELIVQVRNRVVHGGSLGPDSTKQLVENLSEILNVVLKNYPDYFLGSIIFVDDVHHDGYADCSMEGDQIISARRKLYSDWLDSKKFPYYDEEWSLISLDDLKGVYYESSEGWYPLNFLIKRKTLANRGMYFFNGYDGERGKYISYEDESAWLASDERIDRVFGQKGNEDDQRNRVPIDL